MKKTIIRVTLEVEVFDRDAFRNAAIEQAKKDGLEVGPDSGFDPDDISDCAKMIFDPGVSPPGCQIEESSVETIGIADDDDEEEEGADDDDGESDDTGTLASIGSKATRGERP